MTQKMFIIQTPEVRIVSQKILEKFIDEKIEEAGKTVNCSIINQIVYDFCDALSLLESIITPMEAFGIPGYSEVIIDKSSTRRALNKIIEVAKTIPDYKIEEHIAWGFIVRENQIIFSLRVYNFDQLIHMIRHTYFQCCKNILDGVNYVDAYATFNVDAVEFQLDRHDILKLHNKCEEEFGSKESEDSVIRMHAYLCETPKKVLYSNICFNQLVSERMELIREFVKKENELVIAAKNTLTNFVLPILKSGYATTVNFTLPNLDVVERMDMILKTAICRDPSIVDEISLKYTPSENEKSYNVSIAVNRCREKIKNTIHLAYMEIMREHETRAKLTSVRKELNVNECIFEMHPSEVSNLYRSISEQSKH